MIVIDEAALRTLVISEADLSETIMRACILRRMVFIEDETGGLILIGSQDDAETLGLRFFITRNGQPAAYFDVDRHPESAGLMARFGIVQGETPAIILPDGQVFRRPTIRALADATGISSKIEHYFGFPTGISGQALAGRGLSQARKFGAEVAVPVFAVKVDCAGAHADGYAITLHAHTEVCALHGDGHLAELALCTHGAAAQRLPVRHLFLFLGAQPNTDWLNDCVALDDKQFVLTGADVPLHAWCSARAPFALETSRPGIFAVGDVRSGSCVITPGVGFVKRAEKLDNAFLSRRPAWPTTRPARQTNRPARRGAASSRPLPPSAWQVACPR